MDQRERIELILGGMFAVAGVPPPLLRDLHVVIADDARDQCMGQPFPDVESMASASRVTIVEVDAVAHLPGCAYDERGCCVRRTEDAAQRTLVLLTGLAYVLLARTEAPHQKADAVLLAAELAAPSAYVLRRGVDAAVALRPTMPAWFMRAWGRSLLKSGEAASTP